MRCCITGVSIYLLKFEKGTEEKNGKGRKCDEKVLDKCLQKEYNEVSNRAVQIIKAYIVVSG